MLLFLNFFTITIACIAPLGLCKLADFYNASDFVLCGDDTLDFEPTVQSHLVEAIGKFGHSLVQKLHQIEPGNLIVSPLSVYSILTVLVMGSLGSTRSQLEDVLDLNGFSWPSIVKAGDYLTNILVSYKSNVRLDLANRVYVTDELVIPQPFADAATFGLGGRVDSIDFKSSDYVVAEINHFVNLATHGRIPKFMDGYLDNDTSIAIISAVFFEADWRFPVEQINQAMKFNARCLKPNVHSSWLKITGRMAYRDSDAAGVRLLRIPYDVGVNSLVNVELLIALPKQNPCGIDTWFKNATWDELMKAFTETKMMTVSLLMPKFKILWAKDLQDSIRALGIFAAFEKGRADFSKMVTPASNITVEPPTYLSSIHHQIHFTVSDSGTKAAAGNTKPRRVPRQAGTIRFEVKNSFYLAILASEPIKERDDSNKRIKYMQLFAGLVKNLT